MISISLDFDFFSVWGIGQLSLIQTLMPRLIRKNTRSCLITLGALTAVIPLPGFCTSSANKAYLRALTFAIGKEFEEHLDVMVAHPFAVESEIVSKPSWESISAKRFVAGILARVGHGYFESCGFMPHDLILHFISDIVSYDVVAALWLKGIPTFSKRLERPVNLDRIENKIQEI